MSKYEFDFNNLHLPKTEYKLLKRISRHNTVSYSDKFDNLIQEKLVMFSESVIDNIGIYHPVKEKCKITTKGRCYLQYCHNHFIDVRTPIIISLFALLVSIISLIIVA